MDGVPNSSPFSRILSKIFQRLYNCIVTLLMNNQSNQINKHKKTIFYDGSCSMCSVIINKIGDSKQNTKFVSKDITSVSLPENITKEQVEKEIHIIDHDGKIYKNAEAILKIIEDYPRWKFVATFGRLPAIKQLLLIGYRIIAANRHLIFGPASKIFWLKSVVVGGLIAGILFSFELWTGERLFPKIPVFNNLIILPQSVEMVLLVLLISLSMMILVYPKPQKTILLVLIILAVFVMFDQMRLQPWVYQYFFMLAILGLFSWKNNDDVNERQTVLNSSRLIIASIYVFSGLQKLNVVFIGEVFPWIIEPISILLPDSLQKITPYLGVIVPFVEAGIGLGLMSKKYRNCSIFLAISMHCFILFLLGPFGHNWNNVVWPWNIAMIFFVMILFLRTNDFSLKDMLPQKIKSVGSVIFTLFIIFPTLSFLNLWDSYLSSALYSGNTNSAQIFISDSLKQRLPVKIQRYTKEIETNQNALDFANWSFEDLNVPPYPETRVYKKIAKNICTYATNVDDVVLVVNGKPTLFNKDAKQAYDCSDLNPDD